MKLLTLQEAAEKLKVSPSTLRLWKRLGKGPPVAQIGPGTYRYSEEALQKYVQDMTK